MRHFLPHLSRLRTAEGGATALEFAIVAGVFVIVALVIFEFGRSLQVRNEMAYAMDHGARAVLMNADAGEDDIREAIKARFNSYDKDKLTVDITATDEPCPNGGTMSARTLVVGYPLDIFIPGFTGTLEMSLERVVPRGECV